MPKEIKSSFSKEQKQELNIILHEFRKKELAKFVTKDYLDKRLATLSEEITKQFMKVNEQFMRVNEQFMKINTQFTKKL